MKLLGILWYGMFLDYHLKKYHKFDIKYETVLRYHFEMTQHYYKKAYGQEWIEK